MIDAALSNPGALRTVGRLLSGASLALGLLGLRLDRALGRLARRAHVELSVEQLLPSWLAWAVPESPGGWALTVALFLTGLVLAYWGRQMQRLMR
jgi:hypothetical protein